ncbi:MAG: response regulator transcription factor [Spirochaetes bacterium]|nr:response regulator transcription factor [Spirochaetota bacterium]
MKQKILVIEDDESILTGLVDLLRSEGYKVNSAKNGNDALFFYKNECPDLIILDVMIPEKSGYDVCREIRSNDPMTPIIMLTAKGNEVDKVIGLELGADDYVVKPFGINELLARVRAALRRRNAKPKVIDDSPINFGDVSINPAEMKGRKGDVTFDLTQREINLLRLFLENEGKILDRFIILDKIWGVKYEGTTRTLDQHIVKLRQKIEDDPANPKYIITIYTVGYKFNSNNQ